MTMLRELSIVMERMRWRKSQGDWFITCKYCHLFFTSYSKLALHSHFCLKWPRPRAINKYTENYLPETSVEGNSKESYTQTSNVLQREESNLSPCCSNPVSNKSSTRRLSKFHPGGTSKRCTRYEKALELQKSTNHSNVKLFNGSNGKKPVTFKDTLKTHPGRPTGRKPYNSALKMPFNCYHCTKDFRYKDNLKSHLELHMVGKHYICNHCNRIFRQKSSLTIHLRSHTGEKPFNCTYCKKAFSQQSALTCHLRLHTGEKPFYCTYCKKAFRQQINLSRHHRVHTGEKPFKCAFCKKRFRYKITLTGHLRLHTGEKPFNCSYCEKAFSQKCNLTSHLSVHTGKKPFSCTHCKKAFTRRLSLMYHLMRHTGKKPYHCSYCQKSLSTKKSLTNHFYRCHSE